MKKLLSACLIPAALFMTGCVSHISPEKILPTAIPQTIVIKTPAPRIVSFDEATTLWERCAVLGTSEDTESGMLSEIEPQILREHIMMRLDIQPDQAESTIITRRCANGALLVCNSSRYPHCVDKVKIDPIPNEAMRQACSHEGMEGLTLPSMVTGNNNAYEWTCVNGQPVHGDLVLYPDAQGYNPNIWFSVERE